MEEGCCLGTCCCHSLSSKKISTKSDVLHGARRRTGLDVMRVDMGNGEHRFAACVASYGYMGDLMATSEKLRCLGPARYGLAGA